MPHIDFSIGTVVAAEWLNAVVFRYASLSEAVQDAPDDEPFFLCEWNPSAAPLASIGGHQITGEAAYGGCCDGDAIYMTTLAGKVRKIDRETMLEVWTVTPPGAGAYTTAPIYSDGGVVVVAFDNVVYQLDPSTGATSFTQNLNTLAAYLGVIRSVYSDGDELFAGGTRNNNLTHFILARGAATLSHSADHGAAVNQIVCDGDATVYVAGDRNVSNEILSCWTKGTLASTGVTYVNTAVDGLSVALDARRLYLGTEEETASTVGSVKAFPRNSSFIDTPLWESIDTLAADEDDTYAILPMGDLIVAIQGPGTTSGAIYDAATGAVVDRGNIIDSNDTKGQGGFTDGVGVFCVVETPGGDAQILRRHTVRRSGWWRKCAATDRYRTPLHVLACPLDS